MTTREEALKNEIMASITPELRRRIKKTVVEMAMKLAALHATKPPPVHMLFCKDQSFATRVVVMPVPGQIEALLEEGWEEFEPAPHSGHAAYEPHTTVLRDVPPSLDENVLDALRAEQKEARAALMDAVQELSAGLTPHLDRYLDITESRLTRLEDLVARGWTGR